VQQLDSCFLTDPPVLLAVVPTTGRAAIIHVDPGAYPGEYRIAGGPILTGMGSADLAPGGPYTVGLRFVGDIAFQVDAGGNVTSLTPDSADGVGSTLVLRNSSITVDPGGWGGSHRGGSDGPLRLWIGLALCAMAAALWPLARAQG
jgi:hypothetical protein